jgi:hypothetical protein
MIWKWVSAGYLITCLRCPKHQLSMKRFLLTAPFFLIVAACNNLASTQSIQATAALIKDTSMSPEVITSLKHQIRDYFSISGPKDIVKFEKYSVSFFYKCALRSYPSSGDTISQRDLYLILLKNAKAGKAQLANDLKKLNTSIKYVVEAPLKEFVLDSTLFVDARVVSYYNYRMKRTEILDSLLCISEDHGKNWQFLDRDGCEEFLECHFGKQDADSILSR